MICRGSNDMDLPAGRHFRDELVARNRRLFSQRLYQLWKDLMAPPGEPNGIDEDRSSEGESSNDNEE